ncbi:MAG: hypothetical protein JRH11_07075 [Deltaproteobacteria bacterium]|nr:hypothetical protein [Deltaproteobacteria bacterium]
MAACSEDRTRDASRREDTGADTGADAGVPTDASVADAARPLPTCAVLSVIEGLAGPGRDSEGYVVPPPSTLDAFEQMTRAAAEGRYGEARAFADAVGYAICRGEGDEADLVHLRPVDPNTGSAHVVLREGAAPGVIFEAPHPFYDTGTLSQSVALFRDLPGRALIASSTHRCANSTESGCDGTTGSCGTTGPYRESDVAHATDSMFHRAHVALSEAYSGDLAISLHGMGGDGASLSNGTTDAVGPDTPVARIAAAFVSAGIARVTSCSSGTSAPTEARLCGTTNVQGRHLNGAADACTTPALSATERFVHIEQSRVVRGDVPRVVSALRDALGF